MVITLAEMHRSGIISLLTDFGTRDGYVAAMKAVVLGIHPAARLVDVSHDVEPQDVQSGAFLLCHHSRLFPPGTAHLAVVDPGVGTARRLLAVQSGEQIYLAPDNGLLDFCLDSEVRSAVEITDSRFWRCPVAPTFHGRDILAPVAAYVAAGLPLGELGPATTLERRLPRWSASFDPEGVVGQVVYVDSFGNLITNITSSNLGAVGPASDLEVSLEDKVIGAVNPTYGTARPGAVVAVVGGFDRLEIALFRGSASVHFGVGLGAKVMVRRTAQL